MLVSIITPNYNSEKFIRQTIESVMAQTYTEWELIIVDDFSTDNSLDIIQSYQVKDSRIKLHKNNKNLGIAKTRNNGIEIAKGRFIAFLDSDDLWDYNKLEKQIKFMLDNNYALTYSYYRRINECGKFMKNVSSIPEIINYSQLIKRNWIGCLTGIYDTKHTGKVFIPDLKKSEDFALWLKIIKKTKKAHCFTEVLASYRLRKKSMSSNKLDLIKYNWLLYRNIENLSFVKSFSILFNYLFVKAFRI